MRKIVKILFGLVLLFSAFFGLSNIKVDALCERTLTINILPDGDSTSAVFSDESTTLVYQPEAEQKYWRYDIGDSSGTRIYLSVATVTETSGSGSVESKTSSMSFQPGSEISKIEIDGKVVTNKNDYIMKTQSSVINIYVKDSILHPAVRSTCTTEGYTEYYESPFSGEFYDRFGSMIGNLEEWKTIGGGHSFIDAYNHNLQKVDGLAPTTEADGYKDAYKCLDCGKYFKDQDGYMEIGDQDAYNSWKLNAGKLDKLPSGGNNDNGNENGNSSDKNNGGKVVLIIVIIILLLLIIYLCGYFFLYRKGKLDDSSLKVIYSFLPKPDTKEEKEEQQEENKEE